VFTDPISQLAGVVVRVTLLLGAAWLVTFLMRRAAASTRHVVWVSAIACAVLVPLAPRIAPQWQLPAPAFLATMDTGSAATFAEQNPAEAAARRMPPGLAAVDASDSASEAPRSLSSLAVRVWAIGTIAMFAYLIIGVVAAWWVRRSAGAVEGQWVEDARDLAEAFGIRRRVLFVEAAVSTPMVAGLVRPCVMVPRDAHAWPASRLHVALLHELAHVKRRDCLTQALAQLACALYWFNPLVWIASRRLRLERERACDDFVVAAGTKGSEYAGHLLEIAQGARPRVSSLVFSGVAMARRSQLEGRVMAILDPAIRRSSAVRTRLAAAAFVIAVSVPIAAVHLTGNPPVVRAAVAAPQPAASTPTPPVQSRATTPTPAAQSPNPSSNRNARIGDASIVEVALTRMLVEAAQHGDQQQIGSLLAAGADINGEVRGDGNALIAAAQRGHDNVVRFLLDRGATVNAGVPGDGTPLIAAAQRGHLPIVAMLLERGADITMPFPGDGSPLIAAAQRGHLRVVELLLERGADIEQIVDGDENALIGASAGGHLPVVQLLVSRGANVNASVWAEHSYWTRDGAGPGEWRTPLNMARRGGHAAVVSFLLSAGARDQ
jgi:beta-lactamase regulating signal transducer with metallopeptidase domain